MTGHQRENPALDPTRPWEDSPEVETELTLLVGGIRKRVHERWGTDLVRFLAALLEPGTAAVGEEDEQVADFVNANATAFGFVPLIERHDETCSVTSGAHQPLRRALERIARSTGYGVVGSVHDFNWIVGVDVTGFDDPEVCPWQSSLRELLGPPLALHPVLERSARDPRARHFQDHLGSERRTRL